MKQNKCAEVNAKPVLWLVCQYQLLQVLEYHGSQRLHDTLNQDDLYLRTHLKKVSTVTFISLHHLILKISMRLDGEE